LSKSFRSFYNATALSYEAVISLVIKHNSKLKSINAVIDTGFTGFLSLPQSIIDELELPWSYSDFATLGDGSETLFDIHDANIIWDGQFREIEINSAETDPLLGMKMLRGYRLQVDTVQGGLVTLKSLPNISES
jgi:clan AA aspartic protease